ncbi:MAG TPA: ABC transporter ATP-binding protein [Halanaerobiales bacterium]|nr:ABC transporter ATP-binding protein [Halanaerobiales bacterium]
MPVIEIRDLVKEYNKERVLKGISFSVKKGEIFGYLGPNGAGKTTTIRILSGLLKKNAGECLVLGQDINQVDRSFYYHLGVVFEENNLYRRLSGFQNLRLFADMYGIGIERVNLLLDRFGLKNSARKQVKNYSKGMKQRLLICRALLHEPELLILDEPTGGLDPASVDIIHQAIREYKANKGTVFISTHYLEEADELCDRVAFINHGEIIEIDYPQVLKERYGNPVLEVRVRNRGQKILKELLSLLTDDDEIYTGDKFPVIRLSLVREGAGERLDKIRARTEVLGIHSREANLRDVFITLTGRGIDV